MWGSVRRFGLSSANGAWSMLAWGIAPGFLITPQHSAESATQNADPMNRAFSARIFSPLIPGGMPHAGIDSRALGAKK